MDRLTVQPYSSTNPENLVKIGQKEMVKDEYKNKKQQQNI